MKEDFKVTCKNFSFEGKLIGVETTDDLKGNGNWNSLRSETKEELKRLLALNPGDYLWLAFGDKAKAVRQLFYSNYFYEHGLIRILGKINQYLLLIRSN